MSEQDKPIRKTWTMYKRAVHGIALNSLPIGTLVKDSNSIFLGKPVIWKIADINHDGYPKNSITLISDKIVAMRAFDAKEPKSSSSNRRKNGNNRYSLSNIRQWLNSDAAAGQWYVAQHSTDQSPIADYLYLNNAYVNDAGFLNGFSEGFKMALLPTSLVVALNNVTDGGGSEIVVDKIFLASETEVKTEGLNNNIEGSLLSIFNTAQNCAGYCTPEAITDNDGTYPSDVSQKLEWWFRTPHIDSDYFQRLAAKSVSGITNSGPHQGNYGVRPLCNLSSTTRVSETPDENGVYTIVQF